jgi:hypothetical protein
LETIGSLTERIRQYERQLHEIAKERYPQETELLRQVEGIGPLTALTFVLTLEDPYRFEKSRCVGAYLGLVPASDKSGDRDPQRRISKESDEMLSVRWLPWRGSYLCYYTVCGRAERSTSHCESPSAREARQPEGRNQRTIGQEVMIPTKLS